MPLAATDRRRHARYELTPAYTAIRARPVHGATWLWSGHAYNISEGGAQFELDRPLVPGEPFVMRIELPCPAYTAGADAPTLHVDALAHAVWIEDEEDPPPHRMAAVFSRFLTPNAASLLRDRLTSGRFRRAA